MARSPAGSCRVFPWLALIGCELLLACQGSSRQEPVPAKSAGSHAETRRELEERWQERQQRLGVPGFSVAVIEGGEIEWAAGYGVRQAGRPERVDAETLFQAASISKPIAATVALRLVEEGKLDLDSDVNRFLRSWQVPANEHTRQHPVTLRHLLGHTAGLSVHGFEGYATGRKLPTLLQVLDGVAPANSEPIRVESDPGSAWRYSGGGYVVLQQMIEDVTGEPFAAVAERLVLGPLGLRHSTYAQPLPAALTVDAATGHRRGSVPLPGRWHVYPERAAAGLWTTPSDLARWAISIQRAYQGKRGGESGGALSSRLARLLLTPGLGDWGLGTPVAGAGEALRFSHGGANEGYRCYFLAWAEVGRGVVVMTSSDDGDELAKAVVRDVARAKGWPDPKARPAGWQLVPAAPAGVPSV